MELTTSWKEEGIKIGRREGRQRECELILRMLRKRLGILKCATEARIRELSFDKLEGLGVASLDFTSAADLKNWLAAH
jgi:hypothetical protein